MHYLNKLLPTLAAFSYACACIAAPYDENTLKPSLDGKALLFPHLNITSPEKCVESIDFGAMKNSQFVICNQVKLNTLDLNLNASYKSLKKGLSEERKQALANAQRAWLNYREQWCQFDKMTSHTVSTEVTHTECLISITEEQIARIRDSLN